MLLEEPAVERAQPLEYCRTVVGVAQRMQRQSEHLFRRIAPAQRIVYEEVVQFIGAYEVLGYLRNFAVPGSSSGLTGVASMSFSVSRSSPSPAASAA